MQKQTRKARLDWECWRAATNSKVWYYKHPSKGRPVTTGFNDRSSALALIEGVRDRFNAALAGRTVSTDLTFSAAVEIYLQRAIRTNKTPRRDTLAHLSALCEAFGGKLIDEVTQVDLEALEEEHRANGNCGHTIKLKVWQPFAAVRKAVSLAGHRLTERAFQAPTDRPNEHTEIVAADEEWLDKFVKGAQRLHVKRSQSNEPAYKRSAPNILKTAALAVTLFHLGRRISSVVNGQVDLETGTIRVTKSKQSRPETLELHPDAIAWIKRVAHLDGPLFGLPTNSKWGSDLTKRLKAICKEAEIPYMSSTSFGRKAKISKGFRDGVDEHIIQDTVGHARGSKITHQHYRATDVEARKRFLVGE